MNTKTFFCVRTEHTVTVDVNASLEQRFGEARWHNHPKSRENDLATGARLLRVKLDIDKVLLDVQGFTREAVARTPLFELVLDSLLPGNVKRRENVFLGNTEAYLLLIKGRILQLGALLSRVNYEKKKEDDSSTSLRMANPQLTGITQADSSIKGLLDADGGPLAFTLTRTLLELCALVQLASTIPTLEPEEATLLGAFFDDATFDGASTKRGSEATGADCFGRLPPTPVGYIHLRDGRVLHNYSTDVASGRGFKSSSGLVDVGMDRDPVNNSGVVLSSYYACCGEPLSSPGCFYDLFSETDRHSRPYAIAHHFDAYALLEGGGDEATVAAAWIKAHARGTAWLDIGYYNGLHADILVLLSETAGPLADAFSAYSLLGGNPLPVFLSALGGRQLNKLAHLYTLVHRYNRYRCNGASAKQLPASPLEWIAYLLRKVFKPEARYRAKGQPLPVASSSEYLAPLMAVEAVTAATPARMAPFTEPIFMAVLQTLALPQAAAVVPPQVVVPPKSSSSTVVVVQPTKVAPVPLVPTKLVSVPPTPQVVVPSKSSSTIVLQPTKVAPPPPPAPLVPTKLVNVPPAPQVVVQPPPAPIVVPPLAPESPATTPELEESPGATPEQSPVAPKKTAPPPPSASTPEPSDLSELPDDLPDSSAGGEGGTVSTLPVLSVDPQFVIVSKLTVRDEVLAAVAVMVVADDNGQKLLMALRELRDSAQEMSKAAAEAQKEGGADAKEISEIHAAAFQTAAASVLEQVYEQVLLDYTKRIAAKDADAALLATKDIDTVKDTLLLVAEDPNQPKVALGKIIADAKARIALFDRAKELIDELALLVSQLARDESALKDAFVAGESTDEKDALDRLNATLTAVTGDVTFYKNDIPKDGLSAAHIQWIKNVKAEVDGALLIPVPTSATGRVAWKADDADVTTLLDLARRLKQMGDKTAEPDYWNGDSFDYAKFNVYFLRKIAHIVTGKKVAALPFAGAAAEVVLIEPATFADTLYAGNGTNPLDKSEYGVLFEHRGNFWPAVQTGFARTHTDDATGEVRTQLVLQWDGIVSDYAKLEAVYKSSGYLNKLFVPEGVDAPDSPEVSNPVLIGKLAGLLSTFVRLFVAVKTYKPRVKHESALRGEETDVEHKIMKKLKEIRSNLTDPADDAKVYESPEQLLLALVKSPDAYNKWTVSLIATSADVAALHKGELTRLSAIEQKRIEGLAGREKLHKGAAAVLEKIAASLLDIEHKSVYARHGEKGVVERYFVETRINDFLIVPTLYAYQEALLYLGRDSLFSEIPAEAMATHVADGMSDAQMATMGIAIFNQTIPQETQLDLGLIVRVPYLQPDGSYVFRMSVSRGLTTRVPGDRRYIGPPMTIAQQTAFLHRWGHLAAVLSSILNGKKPNPADIQGAIAGTPPVQALIKEQWVSSHIIESMFGDTLAATLPAAEDDISNWE